MFLGQLLFSAHGLASRTDILRFWKAYTDAVGKALYRDKRFIASVLRKAESFLARARRNR